MTVVTIRGVTYPSHKAAGEALGVTRSAIGYAVKNKTLDTVGNREKDPVVTLIRGVEYPSQAAAARALGVKPETVRSMLYAGRIDRVGLGRWVRDKTS